MNISKLKLWQLGVSSKVARGCISNSIKRIKQFILNGNKPLNETIVCEDQKAFVILSDLQGKPYKFYRGKGYSPINIGRFFCSSFDQAKSFRIDDDIPIIEAEIAVRSPLVIDATGDSAYSNYERLDICNCKLYPTDKREELIQFAKNHCFSTSLSTDEAGKWARGTSDIDAVIIKNVVEGNDRKLPIYDVYIWNEENILRAKNVVHDQNNFELFRENTFKRVDLSAYIEETEKDGWVSATMGEGYIVEHLICRHEDDWYMEHELVVKSINPIKIYCCKAEDYMKADFVEPGVYMYSQCFSQNDEFAPNGNTVRIRGVELHEKYKIVYV